MTGIWALRSPDGSALSFDDDGGIFLRSFPDVAQYDITNEDTSTARGDGNVFGQDYLGGRTLGLSIGVDGASEDEVRSRWGTLASWWRGDPVRLIPGAMMELVADSGRSAFGRPRRFAPSAIRLHESPPMIDFEADFSQADTLWYGEERAVRVTMSPGLGGGLVAPLVAPLSTTATSDRSQPFEVDGEVPTWGVYRVHGPITNPVLSLVNRWSFGLAMTIPYDRAVVVDTRPWSRSVQWDTGGPAGPIAAGSTALAATSIPVGSNEFNLSGATTGSPYVDVAFRDAHTAP